MSKINWADFKYIDIILPIPKDLQFNNSILVNIVTAKQMV